MLSCNSINKSLESLSIANCSTLSISKLRYLTIDCYCLLKVNAIDKKIISKTIVKISNKIDKRELKKVRMQIF